MENSPLPPTEYLAAADRLFSAIQAGVMKSEAAGMPMVTPEEIIARNEIALVNIVSLTSLLISKGVLTQAEVQDAILGGMRGEVMRMENALADHVGEPVSLL